VSGNYQSIWVGQERVVSKRCSLDVKLNGKTGIIRWCAIGARRIALSWLDNLDLYPFGSVVARIVSRRGMSSDAPCRGDSQIGCEIAIAIALRWLYVQGCRIKLEGNGRVGSKALSVYMQRCTICPDRHPLRTIWTANTYSRLMRKQVKRQNTGGPQHNRSDDGNDDPLLPYR